MSAPLQPRARIGALLLLVAVAGLAFYLRSAGLLRGLDRPYGYHPDEPKQIVALEHFLNGRYVWYHDTPYYDGYPLALNHLDEWLMRPLLWVKGNCDRHLTPGAGTQPVPARLTLYYWVRGLRLAYAMALLWLAWRTARRMCERTWSAGLALLWLALAPLPVVVAHFGTGDIGVDLCTAAALLVLARHAASPRAGWLVLAGAAVGVGFACKYQAALAATVIVLYLAVDALTAAAGRRLWRARVRDGLLAAAGGLAGAVLATPAFFIAGGRTWQDICANFRFIRNYGVTEAFLALPFLAQVRLSLGENVAKVGGALGWSVLAAALLGAGLAAAHAWAWRRTPPANGRGGPDAAAATDRRRRHAAWWLAVALFPFPVLLISVAGKPDAQPFHCAYLAWPLLLGAAYAVASLAARGAAGRWAALLLGAVCTGELARWAEREHFFWTRADTLPYHELLENRLFRTGAPAGSAEASLKQAFVEPLGAAVFRNRAREVLSRYAPFWNTLHTAPVPGVPGGLDGDWIFDNGPVLPRNDRLFAVGANRSAARHVVYHARPGPVTCGLRAGAAPVRVTVTFGGDARTVVLAPHTQQTVLLQPHRWRTSRERGAGGLTAWLVPLQVQSDNGPAWVAVLSDPRDTALFELFGGQGDRPPAWPADVTAAAIVEAVARARFLEDATPVEVSTRDATQLAAELALPAGLYRVACDVRAEAPATLALTLGDPARTPLFQARHEFALTAGVQTVSFACAKAFAPYTVALQARCLQGGARITAWRIEPDTPALLAAWRQWQATGVRPTWLSAWPLAETAADVAATGPERPLEAVCANAVRLATLALPARIVPGQPFALMADVRVEAWPVTDFDELALFVHLRAEGQVQAVHVTPLGEVFSARAAARPLVFTAAADLAPGTYEATCGLFNGRTRLRLPVAGPHLDSREVRKRYIRAGTLDVVPAAPGP